MYKYALFLALAFLLMPTAVASAQVEPDLPPPLPDEAMPFFDEGGGGGLPGPANIPPPDPKAQGMTDELWDYANLRGMVSMLQSVWVLANQNFIINATITVGIFAMAILWIVATLRQRSSNL